MFLYKSGKLKDEKETEKGGEGGVTLYSSNVYENRKIGKYEKR